MKEHTNGHTVNGLVPGGLGGSSALDMAVGKDREYLRRAITNGWPIRADDMSWYYEQLRWAAEKARGDGDAREVNACVRTMVAIVGQRQSDEQLAEKGPGGTQVNVQVNQPREFRLEFDRSG